LKVLAEVVDVALSFFFQLPCVFGGDVLDELFVAQRRRPSVRLKDCVVE
jgi:hypothetical protein